MRLNKKDKEDIIQCINDVKNIQERIEKNIKTNYDVLSAKIGQGLEKLGEYQKIIHNEMAKRFDDLKNYQETYRKEMLSNFAELQGYQGKHWKETAERYDDLKNYQETYHKETLSNFAELQEYQGKYWKETAERFDDLKVLQNELQLGINRNDISAIHSLEVMASLYNALLHQISELKELYIMNSKCEEGSSDHLLARKMIKNKWRLVDRLYHEPINIKCEICDTVFETGNAEKFISEDLYGGGKLVRYKCPGCGIIFGPNKMLDLAENELGEEYSLHYSIYNEGDTTVSECKTFYELRPEKGKKYLNYGCGAWSKTITQLREEGYDVWGYDPYAPTNSEYIYNDYNHIKDMKFDGIFSHDLLEHLRYPVDTFFEFNTLLKEDGKMAHATACYKYVYEYTRFHLFFYTGDSLKIICDKTGFKIIDEYLLPDELFCCYIYEK